MCVQDKWLPKLEIGLERLPRGTPTSANDENDSKLSSMKLLVY